MNKLFGVRLGSSLLGDYSCVISKAGQSLTCLLNSKRKPERYSPSTKSNMFRLYDVRLGLSSLGDNSCVISKAGQNLTCLLNSKRKPEHYSSTTELQKLNLALLYPFIVLETGLVERSQHNGSCAPAQYIFYIGTAMPGPVDSSQTKVKIQRLFSFDYIKSAVTNLS